MALRIRRSGKLFQSGEIASGFRTSVGAPGTGINFEQSSNGDGRFILGTVVLVVISALVYLLN